MDDATVSIGTRVSPQLRDAIDARAAHDGCQRGEWIRRALEEKLGQQPAMKTPAQDTSRLLYEVTKTRALLYRLACRQFSLVDADRLLDEAEEIAVETLHLKGGTP
jgi:hypothetical protein